MMNRIPILDLTYIFQATIPGIWNQIKYDTFPVNWAVVNYTDAKMDAVRLEAYGAGGIQDAINHLSWDEPSFCVFRVSVVGCDKLGPSLIAPFFVTLDWVPESIGNFKIQCAKMHKTILNEYFNNAHLRIHLNLSPKAGHKGTQLLDGHERQAIFSIVERKVSNHILVHFQSPCFKLLFGNEFCTKSSTHYERTPEEESKLKTQEYTNYKNWGGLSFLDNIDENWNKAQREEQSMEGRIEEIEETEEIKEIEEIREIEDEWQCDLARKEFHREQERLEKKLKKEKNRLRSKLNEKLNKKRTAFDT